MKIIINLTGDSTNWVKHSRMLAEAIRPHLEANILDNQLYLRTHKVPPLYRSGVRYAEAPVNLARLGFGLTEKVEEFACIPAVIERGWGDCFPESTLLLGRFGQDGTKLFSIGDAVVGEPIWGLDGWTTIEGMAFKGTLPVNEIRLNNGARLRLTPDHKVYVLHDGKESRISVSSLQQGMILPQPKALPSLIKRSPAVDPGGLRVMGMDWEVDRVSCWDIQTSDHRVFLPEHDVTVSNCDDLAPWRCAELREIGEKAKIRITWRRHPETGQRVFHVVVRRGDGSVEDPSAKLGMRS